MKKINIFVKITSLSLMLFSGSLYATDYFVCNNGADTNTGSSVYQPWKTFNYAMTKFNQLKAGDSVLFCNGGNFTSSYASISNKNCRKDLPCTIGAYVSPSMTTSASVNFPIITGSKGIFNFQDSANADHDEGYVIKNLSLKGTGSGTGFFLFNDVDFLTVDNVTIDSFGIGIYSAGANTPNPGANNVNENIVLKNSKIINNSGQGWLGVCNNCIIDNNIFTNNGFEREVLNHNIYIGGKTNNYGITVSNNTLYKAARVNGKCSGTSLVVHGVISNLTIKNNTVYEDLGAAALGCWGISVDPGWTTQEKFDRIQITGNLVTNVGGVGIGCASCTNSDVLNNKITHSQNENFVAIKVPVRSEDTVKTSNLSIGGNYIDLYDPLNVGKKGIVGGQGVFIENDNEIYITH
ncbi:MAG: right-handed parallel beta-helix repeat-containing protein [Nitrososphaeraceae archaeon]